MLSLTLMIMYRFRAVCTIPEVRHTYMDLVTRIVEKNFSFQLGNWCREHGVCYIGHLIEDNNQHTKMGSSLGHFFQGLGGQDMAGIDDIGGQVYPGGEEDSYDMGTFRCRDGEFYLHRFQIRIARPISMRMGRILYIVILAA